MSLFRKKPHKADTSDSSLVIASLGGDRKAFEIIVSRYQSLLCSLAYASVGDLKYSEDIAQEAFIEAWRKLASLRDPEKLKSWLCGILRFKVSHHLRAETRQPLWKANELEEETGDAADKTSSLTEEANIEHSAIKQQEQALLWETLEQLPENYRAPLVLFYREQCSVEQVAYKLELSEDTAKQRLSRGRKLLHAAMVTFVEDTLAKSKPGTAFTLAVMVGIANIPAPAKAAALGTGVFKAGTALKWSGLFVILTSLSGVIGSLFSLRASLDQSRTQQERNRTIKIVTLFFIGAFIYVVGMFFLKHAAINNPSLSINYAIISQVLVASFVISYLILLIHMLSNDGKFRAQQSQQFPEAFKAPDDAPNSKSREYKSSLSLFGVPLIHFKLGMPELGDKPAYAWVAGGDRAYGLLFAWGAFAVAPISVGIVSLGFLSIGAIGIGILGVGTVAFGIISFGASAIGYKAFSSLSSLAWEGAISGGFAIAKNAAIGSVAFAEHVNNEFAAELSHLNMLNASYLWVLGIMAIFVLTPAIWHAKKVRQQIALQSDSSAQSKAPQ